MKVKFFLAAASLAFFAFNASAQTETKPKTETTPATDQQGKPTSPQPKAAAPENARSGVATKAIPVAEYYEGGQTAMYDFIAQNLQYPVLAKRNRIQGQCIVSVTLNEDGTTSNMKILKNIGGGCGEEALRVVKLLKFKAPGFSVQSSIPVNFKL